MFKRIINYISIIDAWKMLYHTNPFLIYVVNCRAFTTIC